MCFSIQPEGRIPWIGFCARMVWMGERVVCVVVGCVVDCCVDVCVDGCVCLEDVWFV